MLKPNIFKFAFWLDFSLFNTLFCWLNIWERIFFLSRIKVFISDWQTYWRILICSQSELWMVTRPRFNQNAIPTCTITLLLIRLLLFFIDGFFVRFQITGLLNFSYERIFQLNGGLNRLRHNTRSRIFHPRRFHQIALWAWWHATCDPSMLWTVNPGFFSRFWLLGLNVLVLKRHVDWNNLDLFLRLVIYLDLVTVSQIRTLKALLCRETIHDCPRTHTRSKPIILNEINLPRRHYRSLFG